MRTVFLGTPAWAASYLSPIQSAGAQIVMVISQPDRPRSRGRRLQPTPVKQAAVQMGLPLLQPEKVNAPQMLAQLRQLEPDLLLVVAYGQILGRPLLDLPRLGALNVHYSLLPKLRGPAPVQHALLQGLEVTGVTLQKMALEVDAGDILLQQKVPIAPDDNADVLCRKLTEAGVELVGSALPGLSAGRLAATQQDHAEATFAPMLAKADQQLDFRQSAVQLRNRIRAMAPRPGAYCRYRGRRLKITMAEVCGQCSGQAGEAGTVVEIDPEVGPIVQTGEGLLIVTRLQPEGARQMTAAEWLRGARLEPGVRLCVEVDK